MSAATSTTTTTGDLPSTSPAITSTPVATKSGATSASSAASDPDSLGQDSLVSASSARGHRGGPNLSNKFSSESLHNAGQKQYRIQTSDLSQSNIDLHNDPSIQKSRSMGHAASSSAETHDSSHLDTHGPHSRSSSNLGPVAAKQRQRSKKEEKKWRKKMKEIGRRHPEFELTYDLLLGIRTSTSLMSQSILRGSINKSRSGRGSSRNGSNRSGVLRKETFKLRSSMGRNSIGGSVSRGSRGSRGSRAYDSDDSSAAGGAGDSSDDDSSIEDEEDLGKEFVDSKRYSFPASGSSQTPPHSMNDFEFKDYRRPVFAQLREWFGVEPQEYLVKLCGGFNLLEFISNSKSGQFFFYSHDGQFLIKSMTRGESSFLRKILPQYYHYVQQQPNTLLTKFYGMYRVKTHNRQPIYFVVMGSVFYTDLEIHRIYDLKGSTHGRNATSKEKQQETPVLKDLDFLEDQQIVKIGKDKAKLFTEQLRRDLELLRKLKIMDYSLLLGIHYRDRKNQATPLPEKDNSSKNVLNQMSPPPTGLAEAAGALSRGLVSLAAAGAATPSGGATPSSSKPGSKRNSLKTNDLNGVKSKNSPLPALPDKTPNAAKSKSDSAASAASAASVGSNGSAGGSGGNANATNVENDENGGNGADAGGTGNPEVTNGLSLAQPKALTEEMKRTLVAPIGPEQSQTPLTPPSRPQSGGHLSASDSEHELDHREEKNDNVAPIKPNFVNKPRLQRIGSRRLSQIGAGGSRFVVKTPLEKNFDMPELLDSRQLRGEEKEEEIHGDGSLFSTDHGGMGYYDDNGNPHNEIYFTGIIDILQKYNKRKQVEHFFRGLNTEVSTISCVPPDAYSSRMIEFLKGKIV